MIKHKFLIVLALLSTTAGAPAISQPGAGASAEANASRWPAARSPAALTDPATEAMIDRLLKRMTVEQKVGQTIQGDISSVTPADMAKYPLGSILAGGNSGPYTDERADAAKWAKLVGAYRAASRKAGAGIPILFGVDAVHGHSNLPGATIFPHNIGLGATHDPALIEKIGAATAAEVAGSGIEWTFAPTLAVPQDLRWGRSYEGYAADPRLVVAYAKAMTLGLQGSLIAGTPLAANKVASTAKHFLADGGTANGKDQGDAQISESELIAKHAQGYPAAIDAGALTVMASFSSWNGVKNHGNRSLLTDVLKDRMGFTGLVVGDWNGHGQIPGCTVNDCAASLNAGLDLFMAPDSWKGLFDATVRDVKGGKVSAARLDDAVRRVLRVKAKLGLLGDKPVERGDAAQVGAAAHLAIAREAVAKSLVLLKNDGVLPIKAGARVLIAGPGADDMAMQAGGWTITWQGTDTTAADYPNGQTIGRAVADAVRAAGGTATLDPAGKVPAQKPDVAIVVYGERPYAEFQGDIPDLAFRPTADEDKLLARLRAAGIKVVSIFLSGRPLFTGTEMNASDAFVAGWLPGTQGAGVADVLVAKRDGRTTREFTAKLPFGWPDDARSPIAKPLFPVGYGLTYQQRGKVATVNTDPRVDLAASRSDERYFARGRAVTPWRLGVDASVTQRSVDMAAQEDASLFTWTAPGAIALDGPAVDLRRQRDQGFVVRLDWLVRTIGDGPVRLTVDGATIDISKLVAALPRGSRSVTRIPLTCFADGGAKLAAVGTPTRLAAGRGFEIALRDIHIEAVGETLPLPGGALIRAYWSGLTS